MNVLAIVLSLASIALSADAHRIRRKIRRMHRTSTKPEA